MRGAFFRSLQGRALCFVSHDPPSGEEMERIVADAYAQPDAIVQKVRKALMD